MLVCALLEIVVGSIASTAWSPMSSVGGGPPLSWDGTVPSWDGRERAETGRVGEGVAHGARHEAHGGACAIHGGGVFESGDCESYIGESIGVGGGWVVRQDVKAWGEYASHCFNVNSFYSYRCYEVLDGVS